MVVVIVVIGTPRPQACVNLCIPYIRFFAPASCAIPFMQVAVIALFALQLRARYPVLDIARVVD